MTSTPQPSTSFDHDPHQDVLQVHHFLNDSHPDEFSVVKELLQNAHDARANRFELVLHPGGDALNLSLGNSLLDGPGVLVFNDGRVEDKHLASIRSLQRSTKGTEEASIGRFGRGQKSVFRWSEAMVVFRPRDGAMFCRTPWPDGHRPDDWGELDGAQLDRFLRGLPKELAPASGTDGLFLWLPISLIVIAGIAHRDHRDRPS